MAVWPKTWSWCQVSVVWVQVFLDSVFCVLHKSLSYVFFLSSWIHWMGGLLPQLDHRGAIQSFCLFCLHKKDIVMWEITHKSVCCNELWKNDDMSRVALFLPAGLEGDKDLQFLMNGGDLLKVRSGSWKQARFYKLQEDCKTMWQESKKAFKSKQTCESWKGCAQGCVSKPFLCMCACVLYWPTWCFVCQN